MKMSYGKWRPLCLGFNVLRSSTILLYAWLKIVVHHGWSFSSEFHCIAIKSCVPSALCSDTKGSALKSILCLIHPMGHIHFQRFAYTCVMSLKKLRHYIEWDRQNLFNRKVSKKSKAMTGKAVAVLRIIACMKYLLYVWLITPNERYHIACQWPVHVNRILLR